ncbi:MAG: hypothetical protein VYE73_07425 [Acidobacteriota bacterium]|nr:hypothetical protein [Acidobacteriota bacterium]
MSKREEALEEFDESRRDFVRKAGVAGFVAPVVASFTMSGLMARPAAAQAPNQSP